MGTSIVRIRESVDRAIRSPAIPDADEARPATENEARVTRLDSSVAGIELVEGEPFQRQKGRIVERFTVREKELMDDFTRRIAREQFALGHMQVGAVALPEIFPVLEGQMVPIEDISKMVHEGKLDSPVAEEMVRRLPKGELVTVPGVGHAPTLVEPAVVAALERFL